MPETDLHRLLRSMEPVLLDERFVFATLPVGAAVPDGCVPVMIFREAEGITLIVRADELDAATMGAAAGAGAGVITAFPCRMLTLTVHSSLEAVGFLAAIAQALAAAGISLNAVSAFHHDHLFVPADRAEEALAILRALGRA